MTKFPVDLSSDTQTRPTPGMRAAIANAEVGDEQKREDPSVNKLQEMVAHLTGKEASLFLPTGTMCNLIAHAIHCRPGDEIIIDSQSHPVHFEGGGPAVHSRASIRALETTNGVFTPEHIESVLRPDDAHFPRSRLVCVENTHNLKGGRVWPLGAIQAVANCARRHGLLLHLDGARLFNAVVAAEVPAKDICKHFDSCWIDFSKGLGCPVGAVIAGNKDFIAQAWRLKHLFGGAMRQAGIIAAACVYALDNHIPRIAEDHLNARKLAQGLAQIKGISVDVAAVETNIVIFDIAASGITRAEFLERLIPHGVRFSGLMKPTALRGVTHLDITTAGIDKAIDAVNSAISKRS